MFKQALWDDLAVALRGRLVQPEDTDYDEVRQVFNAMIDKRPRAIAMCVDVADVMRCVRFARESGILLAIRGGGHNGGGLGVCDDGLVIDLSNMKGVRVDPVAKTARVEGGCTWGDIDHATHAFGLACPAGIISTTGMGLTLGGGIGHLTRSCGLTIDNILGADLVLADGRFVSVDANHHPDLFWAIRGGGGNFGVVTSILLRLHEVHTVVAGPTLFPLARAAEVLRWYRAFLPAAPRELNGFFTFLKVPEIDLFPPELHRQNMCGVVWCCTSEEAQALPHFEAVQRMNPAFHKVMAMPYPTLQSFFDPLYCRGHQWYWRADFIKELSDAAIEQHTLHGKVPTMLSTMHLYPVDGAAHDVARNATPYDHRSADWAEVIVGVDPDPANKDLVTKWCLDYHEAVHPHGAGGAYVNFLMDEGDDRVRATYGDNYARLLDVKRRYDPDNLFRVNQNIRPT